MMGKASIGTRVIGTISIIFPLSLSRGGLGELNLSDTVYLPPLLLVPF